MGYWIDWKPFLVLAPILGLLALGLVITLRSGVASLSSHQGIERLFENLSYMLLRIAGYGVGLMALHRFIGAPFSLSW